MHHYIYIFFFSVWSLHFHDPVSCCYVFCRWSSCVMISSLKLPWTGSTSWTISTGCRTCSASTSWRSWETCSCWTSSCGSPERSLADPSLPDPTSRQRPTLQPRPQTTFHNSPPHYYAQHITSSVHSLVFQCLCTQVCGLVILTPLSLFSSFHCILKAVPSMKTCTNEKKKKKHLFWGCLNVICKCLLLG